MSTRSQILFWERPYKKIPDPTAYGGERWVPDMDATIKGKRPGNFMASIYHHYDGYPSERLLNIKAALDMAAGNDEACLHHKLTEVSDLAGWYILANKDRLGGVYIQNVWSCDIEYLYILDFRNGKLWCEIREPKRGFWDRPRLSNTKILDEGFIDELIERHCKKQTGDG